MFEYPRGSEWRRWDLHIHTPMSILNNQYGNDFDGYVKKMYLSAIDNDIAVIGVTDYFSIDGYKKILCEYLNDEAKLEELFKKSEIIEKVKKILLLPNIEFRLDTINGRDDSLDFHILLSNQLSIKNIQDFFLNQITFNYNSQSGMRDVKRPLTKESIESFGKMLKQENANFDSTDYLEGLKHITVNDNQLLEILSNDPIFKDQYLVVMPCDKELSTLSWGSRSHSIRKGLIAKSHMLFTSNENNIKWSLGEKYDNEEDFIKEFYSLKPCIHGSDAHEFDKLFKPDNKKYCWIKADPTFEGLKQVVFEPKQRVRISEFKPEEKQGYNVIDRVEFRDDEFQTEPVYFNENLNCIIGGKSTGKSILIQNLARTIDESQTTKHLDTSKRKTKDDVNLKVFWKDGKDESHKIIYIPQTYLNQLSDEKENQTEIDEWVEEILLKNQDITKAKSQLLSLIDEYKMSVHKTLLDFLQQNEDLKKLNAEKLEIGNKLGIISEIEKLSGEKEKIVSQSEISEDEIKSYDDAKMQIENISKQKNVLMSDKENLDLIENLVVESTIKFNFSKETNDKIIECREQILSTAKEKWLNTKTRIIEAINTQLSSFNESVVPFSDTVNKLKEKIESNAAVKILTQKISGENAKLTKIIEIEEIEKSVSEQRNDLINKLSESVSKYKHIYQTYAVIINNNTQETDGLLFQGETPFKSEMFIDKFCNIYQTRRIEFKSIIDVDKFDETKYNSEFLKTIIEKTIDNTLILKSGYTIESALREILDDWYNIVYRVKMDNDPIDKMSPGKKALVLLKILISLAESKCPILIDQPEDDLDNRSIFTDLINFIKDKKIDRQIIVVTHNANIVLGSDSENIIIANQKGKDSPNKSKRFEYRSGSIENNNIIYKSDGITKEDGVLSQQGIQQHICDILEGGEAAFEIRKKKYRI